jgi:malonyl-CoA decarboxylase
VCGHRAALGNYASARSADSAVGTPPLAAGAVTGLLPKDDVSFLKRAAKEKAPERDVVALLKVEHWWEDTALTDALRDPLTRLCAVYLTTSPDSRGPADPVARFHLGNGARLERVNWLGNVAPRGIGESHGIMVNYLYDPEQIEANHEAFVRAAIVRSSAVDALLGSGAGLAATARSQSETRKRRPRKR